MGLVLFIIIAILVLFGSPILFTLIVSKIALKIKEKKSDKETSENKKPQ